MQFLMNKATAPMNDKIDKYNLNSAINTKDIAKVNAAIAGKAPISPNSLEYAILTSNIDIVSAVITAGAPITQFAFELSVNALSRDPDTLPTEARAIANIIVDKYKYREEIKKNSQSLSSLQRDTTSFFSRLPPERLIQIASLMGDNSDIIKDDKEAHEIAYQNFKL